MRRTVFLSVAICLLMSALPLAVGLSQALEGTKFPTASTGEGYAICGSCNVLKNISSSVWLAPKRETGVPITITGTIYQSDGVTPDSGVVLFLYQADAGGYYHRPKEDVFNPTIHGWLVTGKDGRYTIYSIKPSPEILANDEPAHIHAHIFGNGMPEHFIHEFWFEGDSRISPDDSARFSKLGDFSPIIRLTKQGDNVFHGVRNIRVVPAPAWRYESVEAIRSPEE